ncbi:MAG TPA: VanZ family protein [Vicinamibacterales bacterium]|nr:VanZ family protein [Vicinamibacterales bacterium]
MRARSTMLRASRLALAVAASIVVILGAPYTGQIRGAIQDALPGQYRLIIGGIVVAAVAMAVVSALLRIRDQRASRYGLLAVAVAGGALYAWATATGNANVDVVERFHLVEYSALTWLYYRAWHERGDITSLVFPALAAFTVGIGDEALQWLVPARVGELHDVLLNAMSIACGLVFSLGLAPLRAVNWWPDRRGRRSLAVFTSVVLGALAAFFQAVHLGHEIDDPQTGDFLSRYSAEELLAASRDRTVRWQSAPPRQLHRTSIEDHYLAEGVWHVQRRNEVDDSQRIWHENLILEKYFAPVLDFPTYSTGAGAKWSVEQRANAEAQARTEARAYRSTANPYPIYTWNPMLFWISIITVMVIVSTLLIFPGR